MSKKYGTYLINLADGTSIICGNNYKPWWQHALEYIYGEYKDPEHGWRYDDVKSVLKTVKFSDTPFVDDGGLKWATTKGYQGIIDSQARKNDTKLLAFMEIDFDDSPYDRAILTRKLKEY